MGASHILFGEGPNNSGPEPEPILLPRPGRPAMREGVKQSKSAEAAPVDSQQQPWRLFAVFFVLLLIYYAISSVLGAGAERRARKLKQKQQVQEQQWADQNRMKTYFKYQ